MYTHMMYNICILDKVRVRKKNVFPFDETLSERSSFVSFDFLIKIHNRAWFHLFWHFNSMMNQNVSRLWAQTTRLLSFDKFQNLVDISFEICSSFFYDNKDRRMEFFVDLEKNPLRLARCSFFVNSNLFFFLENSFELSLKEFRERRARW